jgi:hypothetical protein
MNGAKLFAPLNSKNSLISIFLLTNQSAAAEAWRAHNPQVPGSKPGSDNIIFLVLYNVPYFFKKNSKG